MKIRCGAGASWLAATLIAVTGSVSCSRPPEGAPAGSLLERQYEYLYLSPLRRFFREKTGPDGVVVFEASRLGTEVGSTYPKRFPKKKGPKTLRIFLVGGSVVQLFDESELDWLLRRVLPGYSFEILDCGVSAYDSYRDGLTIREIAEYQPDLVVLMSGVNEGEQGGPPELRRLPRVLKGLAQGILLGQPAAALRFARSNLRGEPPPQEMAVDFERNIRDIVRFVQSKGIPIVLCALPWNMRDTPPRGFLPLYDRGFFDAWRLYETRRYGAAAAGFRSVLQRLGLERTADPHSARALRVFSEYFLARSLDRLGSGVGARAHYLASLEEQIPPMPRLNRVLRRLSGESGAPLADLERAFAEARPHGLVGSELFEDDMHWARLCDRLVAAVIVRAVAEADFWRDRSILAPMEAWDPRALEDAWKNAAVPRPMDEKEKAWTVFAFRVWDQHLSPEGRPSERVVALMEEVYRRHPALMLNAAGMKEWIRERVSKNIWNANAAQEMDAWWPAMLAHVGEMLYRQGRPREAGAFFDSALAENPGLEYLRVRRAVALAADGRKEEALRDLAALQALAGRFPEIGFYAETLSAPEPAASARVPKGGTSPQGIPGSVRSLIVEAEKLLARPEVPGKPAWRRMVPEAELRLSELNDEGIRLFSQGDDAGAAARFDEALRLDPRDLSALLNRAAVAARQQDFAGARALYDRALDLPDLAPTQRADALSSRAGVLEKLSQPAEAAADLAAALGAAPQDWPRRADAEAELRRLRAPQE